jgi:hypothetical protein
MVSKEDSIYSVRSDDCLSERLRKQQQDLSTRLMTHDTLKDIAMKPLIFPGLDSWGVDS